MRWLGLHFPDLALELHGLPRSQPQVLLDKRQRVAQSNAAALQLGVMPGQALASALALCPALSLLQTQASQQQAELERLALWAGNFSARISLLPPQALLLEVGSMLRYFGGSEALLQRVRTALTETGYSARLALGESALGAELLAAVTDWEETDSTRWRERLAQLGLDQLQLPAAQVEQLHGVGLRSLGDLQQLQQRARTELARRFGPALAERLALIEGTRQCLPPIFEPPVHFCQGIELAAEVEHSQGLVFPLRRLLLALEGFLRVRQQRACRIRLRLQQRQGEQEIAVEHSGGSAEALQWLELCRLQFERTPLQAPVLALVLQAQALQQNDSVSNDLFASRKGRQDPATLLSRLQSRLGREAVLQFGVQADHRPEKALAETALVEQSGTRTPTSRAPSLPAGRAPGPRPGWLLRSPQRLGSVQLAGLQLLSGPERIVAGWWDEEAAAAPVCAARRDYFIARWPDGRCGWLYRDARGRWFLHGWFG